MKWWYSLLTTPEKLLEKIYDYAMQDLHDKWIPLLDDLENTELTPEEKAKYYYWKIYSITLIELNVTQSERMIKEWYFHLENEGFIGTKFEIDYWRIKAWWFAELNEWEESIKCHNKQIQISSNNEDYVLVGSGYFRIIHLLLEKRDLNSVFQYIVKAMQYIEKLEKPNTTSIFASQACYYGLRADFDNCKKHYERTKNLLDFDLKANLGPILRILGTTTYSMGDMPQTIKWFSLARDQAMFEKYIRGEVWTTVALIELYLSNNESSKAQNLMKEMKTNIRIIEDLRQYNYLKYAKAIILKHSNRMRDKSEAEKIFISLLEEDRITGNLHVSRLKIPTLKHLIELRMDELKLYNQKEVLDEILDLISQLVDLAENQGLFLIFTEILILKAKLEMIQGKFDSAKTQLERAIELAQLKGLNLLQKQAEEELANIRIDYEKMRDFVEMNPSWYERINRLRISEYISKANRFMSQ